MGRKSDLSFEDNEDARRKWNQILKYINAKRTHAPAFRALFEAILSNPDDPCYQPLKTLTMLYDFTPMQPVVVADNGRSER